MVTIDLAHTSVREANERIRKHGADGTDVELVNPDARHHLGVGLVHPINVRIRGSAGYFCAGLTDAARFEVDNNVGWGVGDNMYTGSVVVRGNAGAIPGVAIRGAEIVVHGNMGSRAGQVMKAGTLACAGNANFMAGYMMYGGRIIILGDSGEKVGEDMTGGHIFVGGRVQDLGSDAEQVDLDEGEDDDLRAFLDRYELRFTGTFKKIANAGKKLRYATSERQMRSIPFFTFSGASEYWNPKIQEDIYIKSQIGRYRIRGYGGARALPHLADLGFRRDVSRAGKDADPVSKVALKTEIGGLNGANPLKLSMPVMIAPMSYGALSASTKRAVGLASSLSGIAENTGGGNGSGPVRSRSWMKVRALNEGTSDDPTSVLPHRLSPRIRRYPGRSRGYGVNSVHGLQPRVHQDSTGPHRRCAVPRLRVPLDSSDEGPRLRGCLPRWSDTPPRTGMQPIDMDFSLLRCRGRGFWRRRTKGDRVSRKEVGRFSPACARSRS